MDLDGEPCRCWRIPVAVARVFGRDKGSGDAAGDLSASACILDAVRVDPVLDEVSMSAGSADEEVGRKY